MSAFTCCFSGCLRSVEAGYSLFRVNPKGEKGVWACRQHRWVSDQSPDPELDKIVDIVECDQRGGAR